MVSRLFLSCPRLTCRIRYPDNAAFFAKANIRHRTMLIQVLKSKIHRVTVTAADIDYIGSITIDEDLMDAANLIENEQVHVLNQRNGARIVTYVIRGERGSGVICMNGPAALLFSVGDIVLVLSYAAMDFAAAKAFRPSIIFPDTASNRLIAG